MAKGRSNNMTSKLAVAKGGKAAFGSKKAAPFGKGAKKTASAQALQNMKRENN
jgi:hypothetical protein